MKFEYTGRHLEVTPAIRSHVENHFEKIDHLFTQPGTKAQVIIEVDRGGHRSEIIVKWKDHTLTANTKKTDMYQSLTQTIDKIEKQALKIKTKVTDKYQKSKKVSTIIPEDDTEKIKISSPRIFVDKRYTVKPMTAEEAILKMTGEASRFVVFRDAETNKFSVLYSRKDGNYGLIQP